jgi:DNA topoisomerase-2
VPVTCFKDYVALYRHVGESLPCGGGSGGSGGSSDGGESDEEGLASASATATPATAVVGVDPTASVVYCRLNERWEVALGLSDGQFQQVSFVNGICTTKGGQHVQYIADQIAEVVADMANKRSKRDKGMEIKAHHVRNHMALFLNCKIVNPAFDSQTKETLTTRSKAFGSTADVPERFIKQVCKAGLLDSVLVWAKFKETATIAKKGGVKRAVLTGIPKLDDANWAGTAKADKCTLILTEGDSAKALAMSGLSVVGRDAYGVFPLRGKLLNARDCGQAQMMGNAEIKALIDILGLRFGVEYANAKTLRYGHVMVMADQDHDGSHIKGLVINFLHAYWPSLFRIPGFMCEFITPIVKCTKGSTGARVFYTMPQYTAWQQLPEAKGWTVKYYKGLGTSSSKEAKEYFGAIGRHRIEFKYEGAPSDNSIKLAFDRTRADDRKVWLQGVKEGVHVDSSKPFMTYTEFVDQELVLFSLADNARSIPCAVDGLKPSQRKVLYACFRRRLTSEIKVAQLAGYVSEHTMYHHGEQSLAATIIGMAQNFVGANNMNLLYPSGQFGTRLMGGKDAASPRYIFTRLSCITRCVFREEDDPLLEYLEEDGVAIEPKFYVPVIPMVLVNGSEGIGTGWSSSVPTHHPMDIVAALREKLIGGGSDSDSRDGTLHPWFRGFQGTVVVKEGGSHFSTQGVAACSDDGATVTITELPVGKWTQDYKQFLDSQRTDAVKEKKAAASAAKKVVVAASAAADDSAEASAAASALAVKPKKPKTSAKAAPPSKDPKALVDSLSELNTDIKVHFKVQVVPSARACLTDHDKVLKHFRLENNGSTTNMHLFNAGGKIQKYVFVLCLHHGCAHVYDRWAPDLLLLFFPDFQLHGIFWKPSSQFGRDFTCYAKSTWLLLLRKVFENWTTKLVSY